MQIPGYNIATAKLILELDVQLLQDGRVGIVGAFLCLLATVDIVERV
jgi:hypothetical protein